MSTHSLYEDILKYRKLHGRTYQNFSEDIQYWYAQYQWFGLFFNYENGSG